jgi:excisionase family DNA binding protein
VAAEDWITLEGAAEKLHVALDTMRRWVRLGYFPRTKVGKRYLIPLKALDDFLQSRLEYGARPVKPRKKTPASARKRLQKNTIEVACLRCSGVCPES